MTSTLKQPRPTDTTVVTTNLNSWADVNNTNFLDNVKIRPKADTVAVLTQSVKAFGRTGATYKATFYLTSNTSTPFALWKLMWERWVANPLDIVELVVDFGSSNTETVEGLLVDLTKTIQAGAGGTRWMVTVEVAPTSITLS